MTSGSTDFGLGRLSVNWRGAGSKNSSKPDPQRLLYTDRLGCQILRGVCFRQKVEGGRKAIEICGNPLKQNSLIIAINRLDKEALNLYTPRSIECPTGPIQTTSRPIGSAVRELRAKFCAYIRGEDL